jgi:hypothetical protein
MSLGTELGLLLGTSLGAALGELEGWEDGFAEGASLGLDDGALDGETLDTLLGEGVDFWKPSLSSAVPPAGTLTIDTSSPTVRSYSVGKVVSTISVVVVPAVTRAL